MSFQTILVGDNGSPDAERAVAVALSLGEKLNAKVILLGVLPPPSAESLAEGYGLTNSVEARKNLQAHLERRAEAGRQSGINVVAEIVEGMPETAIEKEQTTAEQIWSWSGIATLGASVPGWRARHRRAWCAGARCRCWLFMMKVRTPAVPAPHPTTPRATPTER